MLCKYYGLTILFIGWFHFLNALVIKKEFLPSPHLPLWAKSLSKLNVWVKSMYGNEQALLVKFINGMDFNNMKDSIIQTRGLPPGAVQCIYSEKSDEEIFKISTDSIVPVPINGQVGSSVDLPYYFIATLTPAGTLILI